MKNLLFTNSNLNQSLWKDALDCLKNKTIKTIVLSFLFLGLTQPVNGQCSPIQGDQTSYTLDSWVGYVYSYTDTSNPPTNAFLNYKGYINQSETFNLNLGNGSLSGTNLCGTYSDLFGIRFKMQKNLTPGYYTFTIGGDDGMRLSIDGGSTFIIGNWSDHSYATATSTTLYLSGTTNFVLEYYEKYGISQVSFSYTACTNFSSAPTGISGTTSLCNGIGGTTLSATGGYEAPGATYQWGTGSTVGSNIIAGATNSSYYINPATTTTYWVRRVDGSPCNVTTGGVSQVITVSTPSTQPSTISGTTTICNGNSTTLTASGGTMGTGAIYQWGTGYNAGVNIIAGATGASITVNPTTMTGYWVRRIDPAPCNTNTGHTTTTVNVNATSTAPTSISGASSSACAGASTTLTATGGTAQSGSTYQWGTGSSVGSNIIAGQTGVSITVSPTTTTTYWVRRYDPSCTLYTSGVTTTINITTPPGTPTIAGTNIWNAYGYSTGDITLATAIYAGYYTSNTLSFDTQNGTNNWSSSTSPSSSAGWLGCPVPVDNFTFVAKRKGFPCGSYNLLMQNWDDAAQLYLNGTLIWSNGTWNGGGNSNLLVGNYALDSNSEIEIRIKENTGLANVSLSLVDTNIASTNPTAITGTTGICNGSSTTLTASGGTLGTTGSYQWGTGSVVGTNTISGQTAVSISVSPTTDTTYWVRRVDTFCGTITSGVTQLVTVSAPTVAGSLTTSTTTICKNTAASPIVLSGNTGNVIKWQYANDNAFTSGVTDIASTSTTLTSAQIGSLSATRYFRAVVQNGSCSVAYTIPIGIIVPTAITYNGSWNGTPTATTPVIISSNLTLSGNLNVCSCQVTNTTIVSVPANTTLIVQKDITVAATANIVIEDTGSLVQIDDTATNSGSITYKRNTTPLKQYDYTYWSSPLVGQTLSQLASPSIYYSYNPNIANWAAESASTTMTIGKGYIARAPNNLNYATTQVLHNTFNGIPNNGVISAPIVKVSGTTYNLIGNPYPSAIDIDQFLLDSTNTSIVNGTIYLWTHNTAISNTIAGTAIYNYTRDDYAKYNITGGVKTASAAVSGGITPTGKVAAGQGFFIEANPSLANGNYQATFKNSMRVAGSNNQFFKNGSVIINSPQTDPVVVNPIEKNRVWLHVTNAGGAYDETLVGYITGATDEQDNLYDGRTLPAGNVVSIYSILNNTNLAIQGRALPFNNTDVVPLGFSTTITGDFTIGIENFDGLFNNENIYLLDKTTNTYYDMKTQSFTFNMATAGTINDRFELHYLNGALANNNYAFDENTIQIIKKDKHIAVKSGNETISTVEVFDVLGKSIYFKNKIDANEFNSSDLNLTSQMLIVKVTLDNSVVITKKVLIN